MYHKVLIAVAALGLASAGLYAADAPKRIVIKCNEKKPGVRFDHEQHAKKQKIACKTCHHTGENTACSSCHAGKAKGKKPGCGEMGLKKNPYHITCLNCHKKQKRGPRTCKACHR